MFDNAKPNTASLDVAVLIPCYNEARTISAVVAGFKHSLPTARVYVYDNNSSDGTPDAARAAGAIVRSEFRQGKGNVVRRMFMDVEADVYVLVDGDATYDAASAPRLLEELAFGPFDTVNAARVHSSAAAYRRGHLFGNRILSTLVAGIFGAQSKDMLSGYKVLSKRFVKTFPAQSAGFEIETELLIHALTLGVPMSEIEAPYAERPEGSFSKLSTVRDGMRIARIIVHLVREVRPLQFFVIVGALFCFLSLGLAVPVILEFVRTGLVPRFPTAIAAATLMLAAMLSVLAGFILDSVARGRHEAKLLAFLAIPSVAKKMETSTTSSGDRQRNHDDDRPTIL